MLNIDEIFAKAYQNHGQGRLEKARVGYLEILGIDPLHSDSLHLLALIEADDGNIKSAIAKIKTAISIRDDDALYYANLGRLLNLVDDLPGAADAYVRATELTPDDGFVLSDLAGVKLRQNLFVDALKLAERALLIEPDLVQALFNAAVAHKKLKRYDDAVLLFERVKSLVPDFLGLDFEWAGALVSLGTDNRIKGAFDDAEVDYKKALTHAPDQAEIHGNLAVLYQETGRLDLAFDHYDKAIQIQPDNAEFRRNRAMAYLQKGDYENGWREYHWRWKTIGFEDQVRDFKKPEWKGEDITSQTVLVHCEQGYGDSLQFARYLPLLKPKAASVIFECQPALLPWMKSQFADCLVVGKGQALPEFDVHVSLLNLPGLLYDRDHPVPNAVPVSPSVCVLVKPFSVGLAWKGNPNHPRDAFRSIALDVLKPILAVKNCQFVSLQVDGGADDIKQAGLQDVLKDDTKTFNDFSDTAKAIAGLDLVITVDSAIAHFTGNMGKPVWLLLSTIAEWRWQRGCDDSPWYPTMKLFRQQNLNDWSGVIKNVVAALEQQRR